MNQTKTRPSVLTREQVAQYRDDGFLIVTESLLLEDDVAYARERIDHLFDRWRTLPRRLAPEPVGDNGPPPIARIHRLTALDPVLAHCQLMETCRGMAAAIIGVKKVWCRFDAAVYKYAGAESVEWHQDFVASTMGTPKRSVHFWIPLNDHAGNAGSLVFVPGSHRNGLATHRLGPRLARLAARTAEVPESATTVSVPLSIGDFSIHTAWTTHGSDPNRSDQTRKALVLEFSPGPWSAAREIGPSLVNALLARSRAG